MFQIETLTNRVLKGTSIETVETFIIVDGNMNVVPGTKVYSSHEEAQAKIETMGALGEAMAFADTVFDTLSPKARMAKANVVAAYLEWVNMGRPPKAAQTLEEQAEVDLSPNKSVEDLAPATEPTKVEPVAEELDDEEEF